MRLPYGFKTAEYEAAWLSFNGDRGQFRKQVEAWLREKFGPGELTVDDQGPRGFQLAGLSYSHTEKFGIVVASRTHSLGVDIESSTRTLNHSPAELSQRYFRKTITDPAEFLDEWCKKEAYAKWTRLGLARTLHLDPAQGQTDPNCLWVRIPVTPPGIKGWICRSNQRPHS